MKRKALSVFTVLLMFTIPFIQGCNTDQVIDALVTAQAVADAAQPIIIQANPQIAGILGQVSKDLGVVIQTYKDYEAAGGVDGNKSQLLQATIGAIQVNLGSILDAAKIKNPELLNYISIAVAVVNSSVMVVLTHIHLPSSATVARGAEITPLSLPLLKNARSAKDLKNMWNSAVKIDYPSAVIK